MGVEGINLSEVFEDWTDEDWEESFEGLESYLAPLVDMIEADEEAKELYLNKYEVITLIRDLAQASDPMVSAPSYDYYEINAGDVLVGLEGLDTKSIPHKGKEENE